MFEKYTHKNCYSRKCLRQTGDDTYIKIQKEVKILKGEKEQLANVK